MVNGKHAKADSNQFIITQSTINLFQLLYYEMSFYQYFRVTQLQT